MKGQDFAGMYCPVLIVGYVFIKQALLMHSTVALQFCFKRAQSCSSYVVSAGLLRFLGRDVAELPLVATSREHQGQVCSCTMFRLLIS